MKDKKSKFMPVKSVVAATGVKVSGPGLGKVVAGMPLRSCLPSEVGRIKEEIRQEVGEVILETDKQGIVIKADSLGSLEALLKILRERNIEIKKASIGNISKKDISDAEINFDKDRLQCAVLGFNVELMPDVKVHPNVKVLTNEVIYRLLEEFEKWQQDEKKKLDSREIEFLLKPCKVQIMKGYVFRQNNPAIVGMEVLGGTLVAGTPLMKNDGEPLTEAKSIQQEQETIENAGKGKQVAVSLPGVTVGRQVNEGDIFFSSIPEEQFRKFKELKQKISDEEISILKEIADIMRKKNPMWGI